MACNRSSSVISIDHDSPLGFWTYSEWRPSALAAQIDLLWYFEGSLTHLRERVFPNGLLDLTLQFEEPHRRVEDQRRESFPALCLTGLLSRPMVIEAPADHCRVLGMRLHPAAAYALLENPIHELTGYTVALDELFADAAEDLAERCWLAESGEACLHQAASWITEQTENSPGEDPEVAWVSTQIRRSAGRVSIAELRERIGMTKTRLATSFREQIGVTPKLYARILRFRHALDLIHVPGSSLADVAVDAGFYDQSHMNREFRELGGLSPGELAAAVRYPRSVNVAER